MGLKRPSWRGSWYSLWEGSPIPTLPKGRPGCPLPLLLAGSTGLCALGLPIRLPLALVCHSVDQALGRGTQRCPRKCQERLGAVGPA